LCDIIPLSPRSLLFVVADVMGKGLPAYLVAASLRSLVRELATPDFQPSACLAELNEFMFDQLSSSDVFITIQLVLARLRERELLIANAGHCPLLVSDGCHRNEAIAAGGMPLGIQRGLSFPFARVVLPPFGSALLYTDGVTEARNHTGTLFGQAR